MSTEAPAMTKEQEAYYSTPQQPPSYVQQTAVMMPAQVDQSASTCWYVFGILSTIFCCLPCGVLGMVHAMIAKHEGERGNHVAYNNRLHQAKCWVSWSIAIGLATILAVVTIYLVYFRYWFMFYMY